MKIFLILILLFIAPFAKAQSGYLGSLNGLEFKIGLGPSITRTQELTSPTMQTAKLRLVNLKYELNYSRTINRKSEIIIGYQFIPMQANLKKIGVEDSDSYGYLDILESPKLVSHGFNIGYKIFRRGSLAPIGKFIYFGLNFQKTSIDETTEIVVGKYKNYGGTFDSFNLIETAAVNVVDRTNVLYPKSVSSFNFRMGIGRNYPITNNLILTTNFSMPLFRYYNFGDSRGVYFIYSPETIEYSSGGYLKGIESLLANSLNQYSGVSIELGMKFHF